MGNTWTLILEDDNGFDDVTSTSQQFVIFEDFTTLVFGNSGSLTSGSGTITNVTIDDSGLTGAQQTQVASAVVGYDFSGGTPQVYITNIIPLPAPLAMGLVGLGALGFFRPRRKAVCVAV